MPPCSRGRAGVPSHGLQPERHIEHLQSYAAAGAARRGEHTAPNLLYPVSPYLLPFLTRPCHTPSNIHVLYCEMLITGDSQRREWAEPTCNHLLLLLLR